MNCNSSLDLLNLNILLKIQVWNPGWPFYDPINFSMPKFNICGRSGCNYSVEKSPAAEHSVKFWANLNTSVIIWSMFFYDLEYLHKFWSGLWTSLILIFFLWKTVKCFFFFYVESIFRTDTRYSLCCLSSFQFCFFVCILQHVLIL